MTWSQVVGWTLLVGFGSFHISWSMASGRGRLLNLPGYLVVCIVLGCFFLNAWRGGVVYGVLFIAALTFSHWDRRRAAIRHRRRTLGK